MPASLPAGNTGSPPRHGRRKRGQDRGDGAPRGAPLAAQRISPPSQLDKIVLVTRKTRLRELIERFNTLSQAEFYVRHAGGDFSDYMREDERYSRSLDLLRRSLDLGVKLQVVDRGLVPTLLFTEKDLVVTVGQDGLVANVAKYAAGPPIVAVNPDPERFDGILLPFAPEEAAGAVRGVIDGRATLREVTLAEAALNDGQRLLAFNDLFVGPKTHVSARYLIRHQDAAEPQSSSGVIISTGAGSTGWLSSISGGTPTEGRRLEWEARELVFVVREPFVSRHSRAGIVAGTIAPGEELVLESLMPTGGVIFSDGVEAEFLDFNSGATARIRAAERRARLVVQ
jgi:NAD kinase